MVLDLRIHSERGCALCGSPDVADDVDEHALLHDARAVGCTEIIRSTARGQ